LELIAWTMSLESNAMANQLIWHDLRSSIDGWWRQITSNPAVVKVPG
jgi:hypothetical protein